MKKFNFATPTSESTQEAVIEINNTAPMDFVGELAVSKLKIPMNIFPLTNVPAMRRTFTGEQKTVIDNIGKTPTEYYYILVVYNAVNEDVADAAQGNSQMLMQWYNPASKTMLWKVKTPFPHQHLNATMLFGLGPMYQIPIAFIKIQSYWFNEPPMWEQLGNDEYKLKNKDKPLYSWNGDKDIVPIPYEINHRVLDEEYDVSCFIDIRNDSDELIFDSRVFMPVLSGTASEGLHYTTPVLLLSDWLSSTAGLSTSDPNTATFHYNSEGYPLPDAHPLKFWKSYIEPVFTIFPAETTYTKSFEPVFSTGLNTGSSPKGFDMSAVYKFVGFKQTDLIFPATQLAVQCLDLNYEGEVIAVNTPNISGTIVPSNMYFLKTFLISTFERR